MTGEYDLHGKFKPLCLAMGATPRNRGLRLVPNASSDAPTIMVAAEVLGKHLWGSSRSIHIQQARHNEALKELVSSGYRYKDWAVIAAFYAALHYFEARLHDEPPFSHPRLNGRVFSHGRYKFSSGSSLSQILRAPLAQRVA